MDSKPYAQSDRVKGIQASKEAMVVEEASYGATNVCTGTPEMDSCTMVAYYLLGRVEVQSFWFGWDEVFPKKSWEGIGSQVH